MISTHKTFMVFFNVNKFGRMEKMSNIILTPVTLVESVYLNIKQDISIGYLKPNEKINLKQLSDRYKTSETPIKQALNRLITEGLIESIPRKGMKIRKITWSEIEEALEIRLMMELYFVKQIILALTSNDNLHQEMQDIINKQIASINNDSDISHFTDSYNYDYQFHEFYLKCCYNKKALDIYHNLNSHVYSTFIYGKQPKSKTLDGAYEHQAILDALISNNEEKAIENIKHHFRNAKDTIHFIWKSSHDHKI
jgi:DNA-binding GntR family transcriptional regulator